MGTNGVKDGNGVDDYGMQESRIQENHLEDNDMGDNGGGDNGTDDATMDDYLAEDASLRAPYNDISRALEWLADERRPKKQRRRTGQQEPEARNIPMIMQIRESEVKTREAELETREADLKDRQAAC